MSTPIKTIMTRKLQTVPMGMSVLEAQQKMKDLRIRHLPVVDEMDDIVGVLSQRDMSRLAGAPAIPVEYLMSSPVQFMHQDTSLRSAVLKMLELKISCLLVSDENDDAIGIVTTDDMLWFLAHKLSEEPEEKPLVSAMNLQTIGKVANDLSLIGI